MTKRARRTTGIAFAAALAFGGILSAAPGCTTNTCVNDSCTVTFKEGARSAKISGLDDVEVRLLGVESDRAQVSIGGNRTVVAEGGEQAVGPYEVRATEVSPEKVVLKISR